MVALLTTVGDITSGLCKYCSTASYMTAWLTLTYNISRTDADRHHETCCGMREHGRDSG